MNDPFRKPRRAHRIALRLLPWLLVLVAVVVEVWIWVDREQAVRRAAEDVRNAERQRQESLAQVEQAREAADRADRKREAALARLAAAEDEHRKSQAAAQAGVEAANRARREAEAKAAEMEKALKIALTRIGELEEKLSKSGPVEPPGKQLTLVSIASPNGRFQRGLQIDVKGNHYFLFVKEGQITLEPADIKGAKPKWGARLPGGAPYLLAASAEERLIVAITRHPEGNTIHILDVDDGKILISTVVVGGQDDLFGEYSLSISADRKRLLVTPKHRTSGDQVVSLQLPGK
jgi:hypothetical protein